MSIQPISIKNDYNKKFFPNFQGTKTITQIATQQTKDVFIKNVGNITKSTEKIIIKEVKDILDFLKANKDKIDNGKIFNIPVTAIGSTLLGELARFDKNEENEYLYELLCYKMSEFKDIDYNQIDNLGFSLFDKAVMSENKEFLNYLFSKGAIHEQNILESIVEVKNPEFKKELEAIGKKCENEFNNLINEFSNKKYLAPNSFHGCRNGIRQSSLKLLAEHIGQYKYGTEQFLKKDKQAFVRSLRDIGFNILGITNNNYIGTFPYRIEELYALTDNNKELFKDLLADMLARDKEHCHYNPYSIIYEIILPTFKILVDDPAGFCDVIKSYKPDRMKDWDIVYAAQVKNMDTLKTAYKFVKTHAPEDKFIHFKNLMPYLLDSDSKRYFTY